MRFAPDTRPPSPDSGGVGKTQLATEYVYRYSSDYGVVWWLRADLPTTLASDYCTRTLTALASMSRFPITNMVCTFICSARWILLLILSLLSSISART